MSDYSGLTATPVFIVPLSETKKGGDPDGYGISGFPAIPVLGATAETIDSNGATNGQVLTANGSGGASWEDGGVSFPLLAPNGTIGAPSYSFANDTDTGVRLSAVGTLAGVVGGADRFTVSTTAFNSSVPVYAPIGGGAIDVGVTSDRGIGSSGGDHVFLQSPSGQFNVRGGFGYVRNDEGLGWSSGGGGTTLPDTAMIRQAAGIIALTNGSTGGAAMLFREQSTPTGVTDAAIVYADVLATKTRLMVIFQSGAAIPLATEL